MRGKYRGKGWGRRGIGRRRFIPEAQQGVKLCSNQASDVPVKLPRRSAMQVATAATQTRSRNASSPHALLSSIRSDDQFSTIPDTRQVQFHFLSTHASCYLFIRPCIVIPVNWFCILFISYSFCHAWVFLFKNTYICLSLCLAIFIFH